MGRGDGQFYAGYASGFAYAALAFLCTVPGAFCRTKAARQQRNAASVVLRARTKTLFQILKRLRVHVILCSFVLSCGRLANRAGREQNNAALLAFMGPNTKTPVILVPSSVRGPKLSLFCALLAFRLQPPTRKVQNTSLRAPVRMLFIPETSLVGSGSTYPFP